MGQKSECGSCRRDSLPEAAPETSSAVTLGMADFGWILVAGWEALHVRDTRSQIRTWGEVQDPMGEA